MVFTALMFCFARRTVTGETVRMVRTFERYRIVCLMPSITKTVFTIGAGDGVVAVSDYVPYPDAA